MSDSVPTLWHIEVSHYSEKVRWALDHKRIDHKRRAVTVPGLHIPASLLMTRGAHYTFPVMQIDGETIGDSTGIIAALEERWPEPPLYPAGANERQRALGLEDYFDETLGPAARLLPFHELGKDTERFAELIARTSPEPIARLSGPATSYARGYTALRFRVHGEDGARRARDDVFAVLDRIEAELGSGNYLVGDSFTIADLTAAALFYPLALPEGGPLPTDLPPPAGMADLRSSIEDRAGYQFVHEMYRRHRSPARAAAPSAA